MISIQATDKPTGKLGPEPWLMDEVTNQVMDALTSEGADARFVGGCVRDALAHRPVKDVDIGTPDPPEKVTALLKAGGIKVVPTGIDHGTVTAVTDQRTFEITTLRKDVETLGRRAVVAFTDDWIVDSSRRDFTINAMSASRDGDIYDYHDGIPDLAHGNVRFIGSADERVAEDYLRILRFFRFFAHYGRPPYDTAAFAACRKHADMLDQISAERIRYELFRILTAHDPAEPFLMMRDAHVLDVILPEASEIGRLRCAAWLAERGVVIDRMTPDPLRRLGSTLGPDVDTSAVAARLRLSNREADRLVTMTKLAPALAEPPDVDQTRRLIHEHGPEAIQDAGIIAWSARLADVAKLPPAETQARIAMLETAFSWDVPAFPLSGKDAQALGLERGPRIGQVLRTVENWWAEGGFSADRDACLAELRKVIDGGSV